MAIKNKLATQDFAKEVLYAPATLTPEQKAQAQKNIGMPEITAADAGLVLGVSEQGTWELSLVSGGGSGEGGVQSDWDVENKTSLAYIKNKPFGVIGYDRNELLPYIPVPFNFEYEDNPYVQYSEPTSEQMEKWNSDWDAAEVVWDGTTYFCKRQKAFGLDAIGNLGIMDGTEDNGMPFAMALAPSSITGTVDKNTIYSIYDVPNMLLRSSSRTYVEVEVEGKSYTKCELTDILDIIEGTKYAVECDIGKPTPIAAVYTADDGTYIGIGNPAILNLGDENGFGFFIYTKTALDGTKSSAILLDSTLTEVVRIYSPTIAIHDMSITLLYEQINPIDSKFISEVSWNSITDKPFYREPNRVVLDTTFQDTKEDHDGDGVPETWEGIGLLEDSSDVTLIEGNTYTVTWNGVRYTSECVFFQGLLPAIGNLDAIRGAGDNGVPFVLVRDINGLFLGVSCWLAFILSNHTDDGVYTCKVETSPLKYLDNKYLDFMDVQEAAEILPEQTITYTPDSENTEIPEQSMFMCAYVSQNGSIEGNMDETFYTSLSNLTAEVEYTVRFDGVEYKSTARDLSALAPSTLTVNKYIGLGNLAMFNYGDDTGEPFIFLLMDVTQNGKSMLQAVSAIYHTPDVESLNYVVSINSPYSAVIKEKYLPEGYGSSTGPSLPEVTSEDAGKFLRVTDEGIWAAVSIPNAEGAGF